MIQEQLQHAVSDEQLAMVLLDIQTDGRIGMWFGGTLFVVGLGLLVSSLTTLRGSDADIPVGALGVFLLLAGSITFLCGLSGVIAPAAHLW